MFDTARMSHYFHLNQSALLFYVSSIATRSIHFDIEFRARRGKMDRAEAAEKARREVDEILAEIRQEEAQREAERAASANADHVPRDATPAAGEHPPEPQSTEDVPVGSSPSKPTPGTGRSVSSHEERVSRKD